MLANLVGRGWTYIISLVFIPLYMKFLGMESYGIIGIYSMLFSVVQVLALGLPSTLTRQMARLTGQPGTEEEQRDLARTLETVLVYFALHWRVAGCLESRPDHPLARETGAANLPPDDPECLAAHEPDPAPGLRGGILSRRSQRPSKAGPDQRRRDPSVHLAKRRGDPDPVAGQYLPRSTLPLASRDQPSASVRRADIAVAVLAHAYPVRARFRTSLLGAAGHFAAGMTGSSLAIMLVAQMDQLVLSKFLRLDMFGYYSAAATVAGALLAIVYPIVAAISPRLGGV